MTIENMQFKVNDKLEKRISSLEKNNINNTEIKNALIESKLMQLNLLQ